MAGERESLRDWHRLFGLLLTDFFSGSPFVVEVERDLSQQQQLLDVVIIRRRRGKPAGLLPDGLSDLADHNLITFKSFHEALDDWAIRELIGAYVAYRKLVSRSPSDLLPAERFHLYAVAARFPHNLAAAPLPWQERQPGVYDCRWGLDTIRVVVAGQLPREAQRAVAPVQRLAGVGGLRRRRLPAAFGANESPTWATLRAASGGGLCHVVHDGGFQSRVRQGAIQEADAG